MLRMLKKTNTNFKNKNAKNSQSNENKIIIKENHNIFTLFIFTFCYRCEASTFLEKEILLK